MSTQQNDWWTTEHQTPADQWVDLNCIPGSDPMISYREKMAAHQKEMQTALGKRPVNNQLHVAVSALFDREFKTL